MKTKQILAILFFTLSIAISPSLLKAVVICDSTDGDCARQNVSTKNSLNNSSTITIDSSSASYIPIGTIITWAQTGMPTDADKWLECNGTVINQTQYPILYAMFSDHKTPDYTNRFLRSGTVSQVGDTAEDTIKTHEVKIPPHTHATSLALQNGQVQTLQQDGTINVVTSSSTTYTQNETNNNTANLIASEDYLERGNDYYVGLTQSKPSTLEEIAMYVLSRPSYYSDNSHHFYRIAPSTNKIYLFQKNTLGYYTYYDITSSNTTCPIVFMHNIDTGMVGMSYYCGNWTSSSIQQYISTPYLSSKVTIPTINKTYLTGTTSTTTTEIPKLVTASASVTDGKVTGFVEKSDELTGYYTGASETAPKHVYVRYLIRAKN